MGGKKRERDKIEDRKIEGGEREESKRSKSQGGGGKGRVMQQTSYIKRVTW